MPLEGLQLGKYRLSRLIGSGGMGDVYVGEDAGIGRQVAIKVMRAEPSSYPDEDAPRHGERLFQREMRAVAMLDHPHILPLYDYGEELLHKTTLMYMVMPFRQEGSLADWLRQRAGLLSLQEVVYFLSQAAEALQHAHDHQIIHQDVKPSNFLIRRKRASVSLPDLLLADFGIARISSLTSSVSHSSRGTPTYMAPEQWSGDPVPATDQYALAIMAYEFLTGRPPFRGRPEQMMFMHLSTSPAPPGTLQTTLSAGIDAVILRALSKKPEERFPTISDFATAFQQAVERQGNLHATLAISRAEATTGTVRELTLPGGRKAQVTVPQDVQEGQVLSLEGLGEPYYDEGPRGQLILTVTIVPVVEETVLAEATYEETIATSNVSATQLADRAVDKTPEDAQVGQTKPEIAKENAVAQPAQKTKDDYRDEGDRLYSMKYYEQALAAYEQGLQLAPDDSALRAEYEKLREFRAEEERTRQAEKERERQAREEQERQVEEERHRQAEEQEPMRSLNVEAILPSQTSLSSVRTVPPDGQSWSTQTGQIGGFTHPPRPKKYPHFGFIIGTLLLLVVLISGSAIFFSLRPNNKSSPGRNTANSNITPTMIVPPNDLIRSSILTVGSDTTYPPQEFIDTATGKATGFDIDLITAMAQQMGLTANIKTANFTTIVDDLRAKRYDVVISAQTITPDRQKQVDFVPYFNAGQSMLVPKENPKGLKNVTDLCGKTVGVQDGTSELDTLNAENKSNCKSSPIKLTVLGAQTDVIQLLVNNRVDATFQDSPVTDYYLKLNPGRFEVGSIINAAPEGISVRKGDTSMFNAIQQAFNKVKADGTYDNLFQKWHLNTAQKIA